MFWTGFVGGIGATFIFESLLILTAILWMIKNEKD